MLKLPKRQQYAQIASEEEPIREKVRLFDKHSIWCVLISVASVLFLIVSLLVVVYHGQRPERGDAETTACGTTLAEFHANGCVFDVLTYNWMPARCVDKATAGEFQSWLSDEQRVLGPWPFFKRRVSEGSLLAEDRISNEADFGERLDMDIWSSVEEHFAHCMFMFLHNTRVALGETPRLSTDSHGHANHCFHAIWKGLNGTWNFNRDRLANQKIEIEMSSC